MIIKENSAVPEEFMPEEGAKDVFLKVLIGTEDGSSNIVMRYIKIL